MHSTIIIIREWSASPFLSLFTRSVYTRRTRVYFGGRRFRPNLSVVQRRRCKTIIRCRRATQIYISSISIVIAIGQSTVSWLLFAVYNGSEAVHDDPFHDGMATVFSSLKNEKRNQLAVSADLGGGGGRWIGG